MAGDEATQKASPKIQSAYSTISPRNTLTELRVEHVERPTVPLQHKIHLTFARMHVHQPGADARADPASVVFRPNPRGKFARQLYKMWPVILKQHLNGQSPKIQPTKQQKSNRQRIEN